MLQTILERTYKHKVHLCPHCNSHFFFEVDKGSTKRDPKGTLRFREKSDPCPCRKYKQQAKNPQPIIDFVVDKIETIILPDKTLKEVVRYKILVLPYDISTVQ